MALFNKAGIVSDLLTSAKNSVDAPTGGLRKGATMALPSDSTYFVNPYAKNTNRIAQYRDNTNTWHHEDEPSAYQESYDRAYDFLMNRSMQSGKMLTNPFYEIPPSEIYTRMPNGELLVTQARNKGANDAVKRYQKDVQDMNLFDAKSLAKFGLKGSISPADTAGLTLADRSIIEKSLNIGRKIQAEKDAKKKAKGKK
jgi:hypothetical protein